METLAQVDLDFLRGDEERPMDELVRAAMGSSKEDEQSARLVLKPSKDERALLDRLMLQTQYPSQRAIVFDALHEFEASIAAGTQGLGSFVRLESNIQRLLAGIEEDNQRYQRLVQLLTAYQRSFMAFTILHDSKAALDAVAAASATNP